MRGDMSPACGSARQRGQGVGGGTHVEHRGGQARAEEPEAAEPEERCRAGWARGGWSRGRELRLRVLEGGSSSAARAPRRQSLPSG